MSTGAFPVRESMAAVENNQTNSQGRVRCPRKNCFFLPANMMSALS